MTDHKINNYLPELSEKGKTYYARNYQYGSLDNFDDKQELLREEQSLWEEYSTSPHKCEDDFYEEHESLPYCFDPLRLHLMSLHMLGEPDGSRAAKLIEDGRHALTKRLGHEGSTTFTWRNYEDAGWPTSAGTHMRYTTTEEHAEIMRRLGRASLTMPGSEVMLRCQTLAEIIRKNIPTPPWLVEGLIRKGGAAMVYGPSGVGKSWFSHTLMLLTAAGEGREVRAAGEGPGAAILKAGNHKRAKVCLLDGEMTEADIGYRGKLLSDALGIELEVNEGIDTYLKTSQEHRALFPDIANHEWVRHIIGFCRKEKYDLLMLDNLATLTDSLLDENSAAELSPFNNLVVGLKEAGVAVLIVHHSNKAGSGYRGSTNIVTTLETVIKLERTTVPQAKGGAAFQVSLEKDRASGKPQVDGQTMLLSDGRWAVAVDDNAKILQLVELVRSKAYISQVEISEAMGVAQGTVSKWILWAERDGLLAKDKHGKREYAQCMAEAKKRREETRKVHEGAVLVFDAEAEGVHIDGNTGQVMGGPPVALELLDI